METFFRIVKETALDRQWAYREKFWREHLPRIINTKIFLGSAAQMKLTDGVALNRGRLTGAAANQSVLVFQIGRYIFSEWSHNGKLRAHKPTVTTDLFGEQKILFDEDKINRDFLVRNFVAEWAHSSPQTDFWQREVDAWLQANC